MQLGALSTKLVGTALAIGLCASPVTAAAAVPIQSVNPLVAISVYGTQASAQAVCANTANSAVAAGAAAAAQGQAGCVLPAVDPAAPPPVSEGPPPPLPPSGGDFGINWILAGLGALILIGALLAATDDDDDDGRVIEVSPA